MKTVINNYYILVLIIFFLLYFYYVIDFNVKKNDMLIDYIIPKKVPNIYKSIKNVYNDIDYSNMDFETYTGKYINESKLPKIGTIQYGTIYNSTFNPPNNQNLNNTDNQNSSNNNKTKSQNSLFNFENISNLWNNDNKQINEDYYSKQYSILNQNL